jgi:putative acetyltransferase
MDRIVRRAEATDSAAIAALYRRVAATPGGLARAADEVTEGYVEHFMANARESGIELVAVVDGQIVGEIHCSRPGPRVFGHVLGDLTVAVASECQGQGIGRALFEALLAAVQRERPDVERVELFVRETNVRAIGLYESLGFVREGELRRRVRSVDGGRESDLIMAWHRPT